MVNELLIGGLLWLLFKGTQGAAATPSAPAKKPSKVPWPKPGKAPTPPEALPPVTPAVITAPPGVRATPEEWAETGPMQKGVPGVRRMAQELTERLRQEQEPQGKGTRVWKPARRPTRREVSRAMQLLGGWQARKRWRDADDSSVIYVATRHGKRKAIEVWTSNPDRW